jgi:hypothetical protein
MRRGVLSCCIVLIAAMEWTSAARGQDYFSLSATGGGGATVTATGGNVISLANNLINQQQQFAAIAGQGFTASLNYGGVSNAVVFTENSAQTSATLSIPSTGFSKTFTGASSSALQTQIENFLESDGESAYSQLIQTIDKQSAVAAVDGNPQASTSFMADDAFFRFGINPTRIGQVEDPNHDYQLTVSGGGGTSRADDLDGNFANLAIGSQWDFNQNVGLVLATAFQYRSIGDSEVYTVGEELGIPITLLPREGNDSGFRWQITPWAFAALSASYDQAVGTVLVGGGGTSSASYRIGDLTFTLADQIDYSGNVAVTVDTYNFDVPVDQWIVKNGGDISWQVFGSPWFVDGGGAYSNILHDAAIPNYWTIFGGLGVNLGRHAVLQADFNGDFAPHYSAPGGELTLTLSY